MSTAPAVSSEAKNTDGQTATSGEGISRATTLAKPHILVLAPDVSDPAIWRRVRMLQVGGAKVTVAGFRRTSQALNEIAGAPVRDFGQTYSAGFIQRIWAVLREVFLLRRRRDVFDSADIVLARNLEMLAIGVRGISFGSAKLIYECLDIHRLLLRDDLIGEVLRRLEGWLSTRASALLTSSPAFVQGYFRAKSKVRLPVRLVENKVLDLAGSSVGGESHNQMASADKALPWVIGWFGVIRCRKSLELLCRLVTENAGKIEVVIRGRPALHEFDDFAGTVARTPGITYLGPYKNPEDLENIYSEVDFTWAIDLFEEGLNSAWLLPNRIYEGGLYGSVPIAQASVETGKFLEKRGIGVLLRDPLGANLDFFFQSLTVEKVQTAKSAMTSLPKSTWIYTSTDCENLVNYLVGVPKAIQQ